MARDELKEDTGTTRLAEQPLPAGARVAVIGAGVAGLASAWLLNQRFDVTLYERNDYLGGHTHTVSVHTPTGPLPVDTGFIVYNTPNYPQLCALFEHLGVQTQATDMSFSASLDDGAIEYASDVLFGQRRNLLRPGHWRMLRDILRFYRDARRDLALADALPDTLTLDDYLRRSGYGEEMIQRFLLPMGAAIWSCPAETMRQFPASSLLRFFNNHGLVQVSRRPPWRTVVGGSWMYVKKLRASLARNVCIGQAVQRVWRHTDGVYVQAGNPPAERFDAVVIAAHADEALSMLGDALPRERAVLGAFRYQSNRALLHTDAGLMPRRRSVWSSWNYLSDTRGAQQAVSVTYWMNRLQRLDTAQDYFVSLNPLREPAPGTVIKEMDYAHPVFDLAALAAQRELPSIQGLDRVWFCGSYARYGFHEDALGSAVSTARLLGVDTPWQAPLASDRPVRTA